MNPYIRRSAVYVAVTASLLNAGCASNGTVSGSNAGDQAALGVGLGAVAGFALCKAVGGSDVACRNTALLAGAAGGYLGWRNGKEKDLAEARALEASLKAQNMPVKTDTATLVQKDNAGKTVNVDAWKGTTVGLPPTMLANRSPDLQKSVELTGKLAASRSEPCQVLVSVPPSDRTTVVSWLNNGMTQSGKPGQPTPEVRVVASKPGDIPFLRVQPQNQQQFADLQRSAGAV